MRNKKRKPTLNYCPLCNSCFDIRSCGHDRYFCSSCCIEVKVKKGRALIYEIDDEGKVILINVIECTLTP